MCRFIQYIVLYASFCAPYFLSGSNENLVSITGLSQDGEKNIVYQGNVGYIKLNKTMFEDFSSLEITTIGKESIHIHQIVRE